MILAVDLIILPMIVFIQICTCRYVVPERPPVDLKGLDKYQPDQEFHNHALRVGNIIANLLRSEIRLMLKINDTITDEENHHNHSEGRSDGHANHHDNRDSGEHIHFLESNSKETQVPVSKDHHLLGNERPVKHPKGDHSHDIRIYKNVGKEDASGKTKDCVCPVVSPGKVQPNTLMLEQKIYGASLSGEPQDSNSPIVVQRFVWNPHNVSQIPPANPQQSAGKTSTDVLSQTAVSKSSSTSTAIPTPPIKHPSVNLDNQEHNINLQTGIKPKTSSTSTYVMPKQTSYNPLASLAETTENYVDSINPLDIQEQQETQQEASGSLIDGPSEAESQGEQTGFEQLEVTS